MISGRAEGSFFEYNVAGDNGCIDRAVAVEQDQVCILADRDGAFFVFEAQQLGGVLSGHPDCGLERATSKGYQPIEQLAQAQGRAYRVPSLYRAVPSLDSYSMPL